MSAHWVTLRQYARQVTHVTEFGVRHGISTSAFISAGPEIVVSYDTVRRPAVDWLAEWTKEKGKTRFVFRQEDVLNVAIEQTGLLLLDTKHTYGQVSAELRLHSGKVDRWIILHDTEVEPGLNNEKEGVWAAVGEFLIKKAGRWQVRYHTPESYGLTVLERHF
jgi:hypothetical protein